ncbi:hypothetical protein ACXYMU_06840 [Pontibacter sp. CAU 1760]
MKKILIITGLLFGCAYGASAQDNLAVIAQARATNLSHTMIRELGLNNYQSRKVNEINLDVAKKMLRIEEQYADNKAKMQELCNGVCATRDQLLENVLSTVQYNEYFGDRKNLVAMDQKFMTDGAYRTDTRVASAATATSVSVN